MLRYRPWKYTKYSLRALPCLTQFFLDKKWKRLMEEAPEPERFPVLHRLPLWCASSLACTFRSPVLIRSFCLRVFAFPFGSAMRGLSRVIHPGHIRFFRPFLYRRHKKRRITPAAFCTLSVCSPLFAVKSFLRRKHAAHGLPCKGRWLSRLRRSRRGLPSVKADPLHTGKTGGGKLSRCPCSGQHL